MTKAIKSELFVVMLSMLSMENNGAIEEEE